MACSSEMPLSCQRGAAQVSTRCFDTSLKIGPQVSPEQAEQRRGASKPEGRAPRDSSEKCGPTSRGRPITAERGILAQSSSSIQSTTDCRLSLRGSMVYICIRHSPSTFPNPRSPPRSTSQKPICAYAQSTRICKCSLVTSDSTSFGVVSHCGSFYVMYG
jgi:hypothetical protein